VKLFHLDVDLGCCGCAAVCTFVYVLCSHGCMCVIIQYSLLLFLVAGATVSLSVMDTSVEATETGNNVGVKFVVFVVLVTSFLCN
jgi:hypothetical protein